MQRLKGKTAMVVGAGSIGPGWGNGKATAVSFAREGAQVFCVDRNSAAAEETVNLIAAEGFAAMAFTADVSRAAEVEAMVGACLRAYGRIDVLDNNVGIAEIGGVVEVSEADWDRVFAVNLKSAFLAMKHVIPVMAAQGGGSIINISSVASIRHTGVSYVTYATTKAAMNQLTRTTAVEFASKRIRVNAILPGLMKTPMVEHSAGLAASYAGGDIEAMARARCPGADGTHGRRLGRRQRRAVSRLRRIEIRHRHRAGGRWRTDLEGELGSRPRQGVARHPGTEAESSMHFNLTAPIRNAAIAALLCAVLPHAASATGAEPATIPQPDPAPCVAAAATDDADSIIALCGALLDNAKTARADRVRALIARAGAYARKDMIDRAIGDDDAALRFDPTLADVFNARGELFRRKQDRPHALADFGAALRLNPQHAAARANYKALAQELELIGAQMAIKNKPAPPPKPDESLKSGPPASRLRP